MNETIALTIVLGLPICLFSAFLYALGASRGRRWGKEEGETVRRVLDSALAAERERADRLLGMVGDLQKLLSAKDLSGYIAIKGADGELSSYGRSDAEEAEIMANRRAGLKEALESQIRFEVGSESGNGEAI